MVRCVSFKEDRIGSFDARDDARARGDARARWESIVTCAFARTGRRGTRAREDARRKSEDMVEIARAARDGGGTRDGRARGTIERARGTRGTRGGEKGEGNARDGETDDARRRVRRRSGP